MTNLEALQWLFENRAKYKLLKLKDVFCLQVTVDDPCYDEDHYCIFHLENSSNFMQELLVPAVMALKKSVDG
ncbi:MAG: hypothetical protein V3V68_05230 [Nitrosomonadaceae bacterium]